jgi:DNA-binding transcriptional MerR regulator/effector-binding domain-containing protein
LILKAMATLPIGDFSRATHLGVKALRHYHRVGLLIPAEVDEATGFRRYGADQIGDALLIKRFRELDLPLEHIRTLLDAPSVEERTALLQDHLTRLIGDLRRMQAAAANLTALLKPDPDAGRVSFRIARAARGAAIHAEVDTDTVTPWFRGATAELLATVRATGTSPLGPVTGLYDNEIFTDGTGQATVFVPTTDTIRPLGRVVPLLSPTAELCVVTHHGAHATIDRAYAALGSHVARHEISTPDPIRETYLTGPADTNDEDAWVTEIGWPVFHTHSGPGTGLEAT